MRNYLVEIRNERKLTQLDMSKKLDISESYYNLIEHGERQRNMSVLFLTKLSKALEVPLDILIQKETEFIKKEKK